MDFELLRDVSLCVDSFGQTEFVFGSNDGNITNRNVLNFCHSSEEGYFLTTLEIVHEGEIIAVTPMATCLPTGKKSCFLCCSCLVLVSKVKGENS